MSTPQRNDNAPTEPSVSPAIFMLSTLGDTTWRMFVPTVGLMTAGYFADKAIGTAPWLFATGVILGSIIAGLLVRTQLRKQL